MVCVLFEEKRKKENFLNLTFNNLNQFDLFRVYFYIHEIIPEYLNHYVYIFDTRKRGQLSISFTKKIINRHVGKGKSCINYGLKYKSRDHCRFCKIKESFFFYFSVFFSSIYLGVQLCKRKYFNNYYYKFLYFKEDNVSTFNAARYESNSFCLDRCPNRCNTFHFEIDKLEHIDNTTDFDNNSLRLIAYRSNRKDIILNLILNRGIFLMNVLTIAGFLIGFNFFIFINLIDELIKKHFEIKTWYFMKMDLARLLMNLLKFVLLIAFFYHTLMVFEECLASSTFETQIFNNNIYIENLTITFCWKIVDLIKKRVDKSENEELDLKNYYLNPHLTISINELIFEIIIYRRNHFESKRNLDDYLDRNSGLVFFKNSKCYKLDLDIKGITNINMNSNIVKHTTLDNSIKFKFNKSLESVYLNEFRLYPNSNLSFVEKRFFRKTIKKFSTPFYNKECRNYSENAFKCNSKFECYQDCLIKNIIQIYNIYPSNLQYLERYKKEFNITEETRFIELNRSMLDYGLKKYCESKYNLPDCRRVHFYYKQRTKEENDFQKSKLEYTLELAYSEKVTEVHYSFILYQYLNYILCMIFIYFGTSLSGLFTSLSKTKKLKKLNSMKLIFISAIIYVEFAQLISLYFERKLIFDIDIDATDSMNIPKITICYKILSILKEQNDLKIELKNQTNDEYFSYLNNLSKLEIDRATKNLSELFYNITFLANDFGAYTTLQKQSLSSLEYHSKYNSLTLNNYIYLDFKCYSIALKFKSVIQDVFDLDFVIKFYPKTDKVLLYIYKQSFLTSKDYIEFNSSALIKFTPYITLDKSSKSDCEEKSSIISNEKVGQIREQFYKGYTAMSSFLVIPSIYKNVTIRNDFFEKVRCFLF